MHNFAKINPLKMFCFALDECANDSFSCVSVWLHKCLFESAHTESVWCQIRVELVRILAHTDRDRLRAEGKENRSD